MRHLLLVAAIASCAAEGAGGRLLAGPIQRQRCPDGLHLALIDALGDPVRLGAPEQQRVTVVVFMSRGAKEEASELLRSLDERLLNGPVDSLSVVDVRKYGGLTRSIAEWQLKRAANDGRGKRRRRRVQRGLDDSPEYVDRWHLYGDFDGKLLERFGVESEPAHPVAFVVDRCGVVGGPHRDVDAVVSAVDQAIAGRAKADSSSSLRARR